MFYSHEILTSRKYGVATVWLVATLGAKSATKKVTKKAIIGVDIVKACDTIIDPDAPMALRLQSNLLYGVTKVYNQQYEYLLSDVQAAQNNIRALMRTARSDGLDPNAGKANRDQLMLMDDPAFDLDMMLPDLGFDLDRALTPQADTQRSSQSMLSIRGRSGSVSSRRSASVAGLDIASSSNGGAYQLPPHAGFGGSSAQKGTGVKPYDDEELVFQDDDLFDFDANGELRDIPDSEREARRAASIAPRLGSDSAASGRVRKDHEVAQVGHILPILDAEGDFDMMQYGDDDMGLPDAEAFPVMAGAPGRSDNPSRPSPDAHLPSSPEGEPSSVSAGAPQKRKQVKKPRVVQTDKSNVLRNADLNKWHREYLDNMAAQTLINNNKKANQQAKPNAFHYVYGSGLNGVNGGTGSTKFPSTLDMFSGEALMAKLTGKSLVKASRSLATKRAHEDEDEENSPAKRARDDEVGRGFQGPDDDNMFNMQDDDPFHLPALDNDAEASIEIERGRDAQSALADYPSSAMPWNVSASLHSHQRGQSSSIQGGRLGSQGPARRRTSASPLIGRGSALPGDLQEFDDMMGPDMDDEMVMYGRSDNERSSSQIPGLTFGAMGMKSSSQIGIGDEEFEIFGAAAAVDTQTAGDSQWLRSALDTESNNFFEYVRNTIEEKSVNELDENVEDVEDNGGNGKSVTFGELFDPEKNTGMVAAQAFYHVLCLATKRRVWVEQDVVDNEPWGEIRVGVLSV